MIHAATSWSTCTPAGVLNRSRGASIHKAGMRRSLSGSPSIRDPRRNSVKSFVRPQRGVVGCIQCIRSRALLRHSTSKAVVSLGLDQRVTVSNKLSEENLGCYTRRCGCYTRRCSGIDQRGGIGDSNSILDYASTARPENNPRGLFRCEGLATVGAGLRFAEHLDTTRFNLN